MNYYIITNYHEKILSRKKRTWIARSETLLPIKQNGWLEPGVDDRCHISYIYALDRKKLIWAIGEFRNIYLCEHFTDINDLCHSLENIFTKDKNRWLTLSSSHNLIDFQQFIVSTI